MKREYKWSPFKFLQDRKSSVPVNDNDDKNFNNFMAVACLSSDSNVGAYTKYFNTRAFSAMPKDFQVRAFQSLNGRPIFAKFPGSMKYAASLTDETIHKVSIIMDCSKVKAEQYIKDGLLDVESVVKYYDEVYERKL